jgi:signal transduction histidine kinase
LSDPGAGEWLSERNLSDLRVTVIHAGPEMAVRSYSPRLGANAYTGSRDLQGQALADLFPELVGCEEELQAVTRGESALFELPLINRVGADGRRTYVTLTGLADPDIEGGLVLLIQDVTERGQLAQQVMQHLNDIRLLRGQLEAANARLVRQDEEKSEFVQMAAHDLRSPLAIIRGYVELVLQLGGPGLGAEISEYLNIVLARTRQMAQLIDALLDVERIELGEAGLKFEPVDLGALVEQAVEGFALPAQQSGLLLQCKIAPNSPLVSADRMRLGQVLNNLLSNALKFTPAGGRVTVELLVREEEAVVEVSDTGPGISEADQAHLFQRFFRADDARMRGTAGFGLGLPIARAIVEQHGGHIFLRSQLGQGSTFGFALPLA